VPGGHQVPVIDFCLLTFDFSLPCNPQPRAPASPQGPPAPGTGPPQGPSLQCPQPPLPAATLCPQPPAVSPCPQPRAPSPVPPAPRPQPTASSHAPERSCRPAAPPFIHSPAHPCATPAPQWMQGRGGAALTGLGRGGAAARTGSLAGPGLRARMPAPGAYDTVRLPAADGDGGWHAARRPPAAGTARCLRPRLHPQPCSTPLKPRAADPARETMQHGLARGPFMQHKGPCGSRRMVTRAQAAGGDQVRARGGGGAGGTAWGRAAPLRRPPASGRRPSACSRPATDHCPLPTRPAARQGCSSCAWVGVQGRRLAARKRRSAQRLQACAAPGPGSPPRARHPPGLPWLLPAPRQYLPQPHSRGDVPRSRRARRRGRPLRH
jgi:hypothetical protein